MTRTERRRASRDEAREHAHTFPTHSYGPRAQRRAFGLTNTHKAVSLTQLDGIEDGKHIISLVPSSRAVKRVGGGRVR